MGPPRGRARGLGVVLALLVVAGAAAPHAADTARVRGRVTVAVEGATLADLGPIVVYLEPVGRTAYEAAAATHSIVQRGARFRPGFLAIAVGQSVSMPNEDSIYHNVFSYSRGNEFDLGLYPGGESRRVTLRRPGVVKLYCSIHESMNGTIFVAPGPHFARVSSGGAFAIDGVPPGRYRLRTWCERLPETSRTLDLAAGDERVVEIPLGPDAGS